VALSKLVTGTGRWGILSLVVFFLVGIAMLQRVNIERGMQRAAEEDAKMVTLES
jgi:UMF1 family MFS transporter